MSAMFEQVFAIIVAPNTLLSQLKAVDVDKDDVYLKSNKIEISQDFDDGKNTSLSQSIINFDKEGVKLKSYSTYSYMLNEYTYEGSDGDEAVAINEVVVRIDVKTTAFGAVNRPSDYYKYN